MSTDHLFVSPLQGTITGTGYMGADVVSALTNAWLPGFLLDYATTVEFDVSASGYTEAWAMFPIQSDNQTDGMPLLVMRGATSDLLRIVTSGTAGDTAFEYWNGSAWVQIGSNLGTSFYGTTSSFATRIEVQCKIANTGGSFAVYVDGALVESFTGNTLLTADTTVNSVLVGGLHATFNDTNYGPLVVHGSDTRGKVLVGSIGISNGTYNELSAGEPNVDDWAFRSGYNSTSAIGTADGQRLTLNFPAIDASYAGYTVSKVAIVIAAQAQAEPGFYVKGLARVSGADYNSASVQPGSSEIAAYPLEFDNDPSTGSPWATQAALSSAELGVEISDAA